MYSLTIPRKLTNMDEMTQHYRDGPREYVLPSTILKWPPSHPFLRLHCHKTHILYCKTSIATVWRLETNKDMTIRVDLW